MYQKECQSEILNDSKNYTKGSNDNRYKYMDPEKLNTMYLDITACIRAFILSIIET